MMALISEWDTYLKDIVDYSDSNALVDDMPTGIILSKRLLKTNVEI